MYACMYAYLYSHVHTYTYTHRMVSCLSFANLMRIAFVLLFSSQLKSFPDANFPQWNILTLFPLNCTTKLDRLMTATFYKVSRAVMSMKTFVAKNCASDGSFSRNDFITTYLNGYQCEMQQIYSTSGYYIFDVCSPDSLAGYNCSNCVFSATP